MVVFINANNLFITNLFNNSITLISSNTSRNIKIDNLRSLAMFIMFFAHLLPHFTIDKIEFLFVYRLISSLAAPLFFFLSGYNFSKSQNFILTFKKGIFFLTIASLIDIFVWHIIPFYSFDVLYCIGFGYILLYPFARLSNQIKLFVILLILSVSIFIQNYYQFKINEPTINNLDEANVFDAFLNLTRNGWFPVFPWISYIFIGYWIKSYSFKLNYQWVYLLVFLAFIFVAWFLSKFESFKPEMAVELFYPCDIKYLLLSYSWLYLCWNSHCFFRIKLDNLFTELGKYSLIFYIIHLIIFSFFENLIKTLLKENIDVNLLFWSSFITFNCLLFVCLLLIKWFKQTKIYLRFGNKLYVRMLFH